MATTVKERIKIAELTKFGFKVGTEYVNFSKQLPEGDKTNVVPGAELDVELYVADSGKRYLNKILSGIAAQSVKPAVAMAAPEVKAEVPAKKAFVPKFQKKDESTTMSKSEWQAKDRSQLLGGLCHDAAQLTLAAVTVGASSEDVLKMYKAMLDGVIALREGVK